LADANIRLFRNFCGKRQRTELILSDVDNLIIAVDGEINCAYRLIANFCGDTPSLEPITEIPEEPAYNHILPVYRTGINFLLEQLSGGLR
jgi:hypothetical protein